MTEVAVRTSGLTRRFGPVTAVDSLSLAIPRGIVFGFIGPNGAGKTTTIHLLLGLLESSSGDASVLGFDLQSEGDSVRANTGALLEHTGLYERLSAEDNLEFYGRVNRIETAARRDRIRELLTRFGLWERRRDRVSA
ncbi:MAG: ATP-binding cassette domain-containing protein, partial [Candidatus Latescibacteria bacterium]|nr:ATP-binding cassette domain-containing protein [Candidatus Latescibacterota bacterium]